MGAVSALRRAQPELRIVRSDSQAPAQLDHREAPAVLVVGESAPVVKELARYSDEEGCRMEVARDAPAALRTLNGGHWTAVFVVLGEDAEQQLGWWCDVLRNLPQRPRLLALSEAPTMGLSIKAAKLGIFEVLPAPLGRERFTDLMQRIRAADREVALPLPAVKPALVGGSELVSGSPAMLDVFRAIAQVAGSTATVLVTGESGTGKEVVAQAIHQHGLRADRPFVAVNCAAIPENLLESELFGHEKGAFTGAIGRKAGRFERAHGGTLFLDEIGDMSLPLQAKILRAVEERQIERVGGTEPIPVDVRLIAATNRNLQQMVNERRFREDLYFRLAVVMIKLPRLSERGDDILLLTSHCLRVFGRQYGKTFTGVSDQALELLRHHNWVGNVRELRNVIERAVIVADGPVLRADHLPEEWRTDTDPGFAPSGNGLLTLREMEARHIARVLSHTGGQICEAARILGMHRNTVARKIKEYGL